MVNGFLGSFGILENPYPLKGLDLAVPPPRCYKQIDALPIGLQLQVLARADVMHRNPGSHFRDLLLEPLAVLL